MLLSLYLKEFCMNILPVCAGLEGSAAAAAAAAGRAGVGVGGWLAQDAYNPHLATVEMAHFAN